MCAEACEGEELDEGAASGARGFNTRAMPKSVTCAEVRDENREHVSSSSDGESTNYIIILRGRDDN